MRSTQFVPNSVAPKFNPTLHETSHAEMHWSCDRLRGQCLFARVRTETRSDNMRTSTAFLASLRARFGLRGAVHFQSRDVHCVFSCFVGRPTLLLMRSTQFVPNSVAPKFNPTLHETSHAEMHWSCDRLSGQCLFARARTRRRPAATTCARPRRRAAHAAPCLPSSSLRVRSGCASDFPGESTASFLVSWEDPHTSFQYPKHTRELKAVGPEHHRTSSQLETVLLARPRVGIVSRQPRRDTPRRNISARSSTGCWPQ
mmetsp:Transcript_43811/g.135256  ORF Transcript_43811/g.135256 Transcript_43811/m.135256 type:complete len:257 (-) Transcript_43811:437-1207(-)